MNNLTIFLNTRVESSGVVAWIGDKGLAPFRYLYNGATIRIEVDGQDGVQVHHVASFHEDGDENISRSNIHLESSSKNMIKTLVAVVLVIPGLLVGVVKVFAYLSSVVRENHRLTKTHFTPRNIQIGTPKNPIKSIVQLQEELQTVEKDPLNRSINALIIHGDGKLKINDDPGILMYNPMKLILVGAKVVHEPTPSLEGRLDDKMRRSYKWRGAPGFPFVRKVQSVAEALQVTPPRRGWLTCSRYHMIFEAARPKARSAAA